MVGSLPFSLRPYLARHRKQLVQIGGYGTLLAVPALFTGFLVARAVDASTSGDMLEAVACLVGLGATGTMGGFALLALARRIAILIEALRSELTEDVVRNTMERAVHFGEVGLSGVEVTSHVPSVLRYVAMILRTMPAWLIGLGSGLGVMMISTGALLRILPWLSLGIVAQVAFVAWQPMFARRLILAEDAWYDEAVKSVTSIRDLLAARATEYQIERLDQRSEEALRAAVRQVDMFAWGQSTVTALIQYLPLVVTLVALPSIVHEEGLSEGDVLGTMTYLFAGLGATVAMVGNWSAQIVGLRVTVSRLRSTWASARDARERDRAVEDNALPIVSDSSITVTNLGFDYGRHARRIFDGLDLFIPPGDHIAIVGPSGIGKSTFAALLGGLLLPVSGRVQIGGVEAHRHPRRAQIVATIPQEAYVFDGSLRDNLRYLAKDAGDAELMASAEAVGLGRVLERLGGLDGEIDLSGSGLSNGEQQLIALARVHVARTPVVILDEATCHLDPVAEEVAERAFMNGRQTLIVIAHRMSAALRARRVLVIDAETRIGTHAELLNSSPLYASFCREWERSKRVR